jgi:hypothetical protein
MLTPDAKFETDEDVLRKRSFPEEKENVIRL